MSKWTLGSMAFLTGILAGAGTGLLAAPQAGARTRRRLRGLGEDAGERTTEVMHDARGMVDRALRRTRRWMR